MGWAKDSIIKFGKKTFSFRHCQCYIAILSKCYISRIENFHFHFFLWQKGGIVINFKKCDFPQHQQHIQYLLWQKRLSRWDQCPWLTFVYHTSYCLSQGQMINFAWVILQVLSYSFHFLLFERIIIKQTWKCKVLILPQARLKHQTYELIC